MPVKTVIFNKSLYSINTCKIRDRVTALKEMGLIRKKKHVKKVGIPQAIQSDVHCSSLCTG